MNTYIQAHNRFPPEAFCLSACGSIALLSLMIATAKAGVSWPEGAGASLRIDFPKNEIWFTCFGQPLLIFDQRNTDLRIQAAEVFNSSVRVKEPFPMGMRSFRMKFVRVNEKERAELIEALSIEADEFVLDPDPRRCCRMYTKHLSPTQVATDHPAFWQTIDYHPFQIAFAQDRYYPLNRQI